ncbi:Glycosyltransferase GlyG [Anaerolineae bacterium]|nr:Glycosyltransferase GlyG [Anaerolineae bacterium]
MDTASTHPKISVVIPCYNQAHYLGEAVRSVLCQTYQDFEIIVVDDGSTDETSQVAASFGERVRCVRQENRGLAGARNTGILNARGEFIGLLDADDMWLPSYLSTMLRAFDKYPTIGAAYCGWQYIDSTGTLLPRTNIRVVPPEKAYESMVFMDFMIPSGVFVRRECFDQLGLFDVNLRAAQGCEDWDMWIRVLTKYPMLGVPQVLVKYRVHSDNMSSNLDQMERAKQAVIVKHFGTEENKSALHRIAYGGLYLNSALAHLEAGEVTKGQAFLLRAFNVYPELTTSLDTFYQLAVASQPVGLRGVFENLDLEQSARILLDNLDVVFRSPLLSVKLGRERSRVYGMAYFALGLLAYGKRSLEPARKFLTRAVLSRPSLLMHKKWILTFLKSLMGNQLLSFLRKWKQTGAIAH